MHSAWIGEHHFNSLGVLSCPDLVLAYIAARTKHIRLAPAVTVLPLHHPIRVAEQWATLDLLTNGRVDFAAGRGYDRREYEPFHVSFDDNQGMFDEGLEVVRKLWARDDRITHTASTISSRTCASRPSRCRSRSRPMWRRSPSPRSSSPRGSAAADRRAVRRRHELRRAEAGGGPLSRDLRQVRHQARPADVQLLHAFRRQAGAGGRRSARGRSATTRNASSRRFPGDPKTAPPSYRYFVDMVERLHNMKPEDLTENSVLIGAPRSITETLKKVEAAGFSEVILYFNVGLKPHRR